jgi:hypothetical protein
MATLPVPKRPTPGAHRQVARSACDDSLCAHLRACSTPRSFGSQAKQALEWLHGLTAPRLVSTWLVLLLIAVLLSLVF